MNKLISTVVIATFTAVCSFGAAAGSDTDKSKETMQKSSPESTSKKEGDKSGSVSDKDSEIMREKSLSEREKEYKDQETMNKKPYKQ